ncbi:MAG: SWEET family sugar transporter [archaeon]|nr:SWEET family sugar transporter [archaeon]
MKLGLEPVNAIQEIFNWIGTGTAILYFCSPLIQIIYLYKGKIKADFIPLFLLLTILFNCLFWVIYSTADGIIVPSLISNGIGLGINVIILFLYLYIYLEQKVWQFLGYGFFMIDVLVEIYYLMNRYIVKKYHKDNPTLVGFIATIIGVVMYLSPAQNIISLCRTGNYQMLPIITNVIGFFNTLIWLLYGVLTKYPDTIASNGVSFIIICAQIGFWAYYFIKSVRDKEHGNIDIPDDPIIKKEDDTNIDIKEEADGPLK